MRIKKPPRGGFFYYAGKTAFGHADRAHQWLHSEVTKECIHFAFVLGFALLQLPVTASAERIKRKPPTDVEGGWAGFGSGDERRHASGDVIATDRGLFQFRRFTADGGSDFVAVPNPLPSTNKHGLGIVVEGWPLPPPISACNAGSIAKRGSAAFEIEPKRNNGRVKAKKFDRSRHRKDHAQ